VNLVLAAEQSDSPFDVVFMDMQMPIMDGYEATRSLRNAGYKKPIIALTAQAMLEDCQKCINVGCDGYLAKPIERSKLLKSLETYTQKKPLAADC